MEQRDDDDDLARSSASVQSGVWLQRELRQAVRARAIEVLSKSRSADAAERIAEKLDAAWREALSSKAGLRQFFDRAEAVVGRRRRRVEEIPEDFVETREAKLARISLGVPSPRMAWPAWASQPWRTHSSPSIMEEQDLDKWRRSTKPERYRYVVKADETLVALAEKKASECLGTTRSRIEPRNRELLDLESLLEDDAESVSFPAFAREHLAPTFLGKKFREVEEDLGLDADVADPVAGIESVVNGQFTRFFFATKKREHVCILPRALAVSSKQSDVRVLYNCRLLLPACWLDDDDRRTQTAETSATKKIAHVCDAQQDTILDAVIAAAATTASRGGGDHILESEDDHGSLLIRHCSRQTAEERFTEKKDSEN